MTTRTRIVIAALLGAAIAATQPSLIAQSPAGRFRIGAHVYFPDGHFVSTWREFGNNARPSPGDHDIYTTTSLCMFQNAPGTATDVGYGWTFDVEAVSAANGADAVRVTWNRKKDRGRTVDAPSGSLVLTLSQGASVPLDYIIAEPNPAPSCAALGMLLEITRY